MLSYSLPHVDLCNSVVIYPCNSVVFACFFPYLSLDFYETPDPSYISVSNTTSMTDQEPIDRIICFLNGINLPEVSIFFLYA